MPAALAVSAVLCAVSAAAPAPRTEAAGARPDLHVVQELTPAGPSSRDAPVLEIADAPGAPARDGAAARAATLHRWGRGLRWGTAAALVATSTLGTMAAMNQPTAFGDGRCATGRPVLGDYGCDRGLSTLHGSAGVLSTTLYTANAALALGAPESRGRVAGPGARRVHRALGWVHLGGIAVQPVLGLVSAFPQVIGMHRTAPTDPFPKNLRTAHVFLGYVTTAAFLTTFAMER